MQPTNSTVPYYLSSLEALQTAPPELLKKPQQSATQVIQKEPCILHSPLAGFGCLPPSATPQDRGPSFHLPPFVSSGLISNPAQLISLGDSSRRKAGKATGRKKKKKNPKPTEIIFHMPPMLHPHHVSYPFPATVGSPELQGSS